jgi:hypothetical protein
VPLRAVDLRGYTSERDGRGVVVAEPDAIWPRVMQGVGDEFSVGGTRAGANLANRVVVCRSGARDFSVPGSNAQLQSVISQLALRLRRRFILLAPTNHRLDARGHELLANAQSALFPLDGNVVLTAAGGLQPLKTPGELFAGFTPEPKEMEEDVARRAFAIVKQLDSESRMKAPSLLTVFGLYCIEELSTAQIARKFGCGKTTVMDRLKLLRKRTGLEPAALRRISAHLNQIESQTRDSRASQVRGRKLIYDDEE